MVLILNNFRRGCVGINGLCFILKMKTNYTACSVDTQKVVPCGLMNGNEHDGLHTDIKQQCFLDFLFLIFYFSLFSTRSSSLVLFCAQTTVQNRLCPVGLSSIMFFFLFSLFNSESFFSKVFWMIVFFQICVLYSFLHRMPVYPVAHFLYFSFSSSFTYHTRVTRLLCV